jgi:hypothetical protein
MKTRIFAFSALLVITPAAFCQAHSQEQGLPQPGTKATPPAVSANYGKLPLSFEANQGQADPAVKFLSHGNGYSLLLTDSAAVLELSKPDPATPTRTMKAMGMNPSTLARVRRPVALKTDVVRMELPGAQQNAPVGGTEQLPGKSNYFVGKDPAKWQTNVPTYAKVKYSGVYPGVDLVYYGNQRQLEYDFVIAPGASTKPVKLHFAGASQLKLDSNGDLAVIAKNGEIAFHKPVVYQEKDGQRQPVDGKFTLLAKNTVGFQLGGYDHSRTLVIDPVLAYSTYLGGTGNSTPSGAAVDTEGNIYIVGYTDPLNYPTTVGAFQSTAPFGVPFITKLNPSGSAIVYSTYLYGSSGRDGANAIAVDANGDAYVTGSALSTDFPVTSGAFQRVNKGRNVFVTKLNPFGSALVFSTFLGGSGTTYGDFSLAIAVDSLGDTYIDGYTDSADFPVTPGVYQPKFGITQAYGSTGFVAKLNPSGSALLYSTFLGGADGAILTTLAAEPSGTVSVGGAGGIDFPTTQGAFQTKSKSSNGASVIAKLNATASALVYSTFFSGSSPYDVLSQIAVDGDGDVYAAGEAYSTDFPVTPGAFQTTNHSVNGFISKINASGTGLIFSTYLGGSTATGASAMVVNSSGNVFVTGSTADTDFPVTPDAYQTINLAGENDFETTFLTELSADGSSLLYSTYFGNGGGNFDFAVYGSYAYALAIDALGNPYVAGRTYSQTFPVTPGAYQLVNLSPTVPGNVGEGGTEAGYTSFIYKFAFNGATTTTVTADSDTGSAGQRFSYTADVVSVDGSSIPTGFVEVYADGGYQGDFPLDQAGHASFSTFPLATGTHVINASYHGDAKHSASSGIYSQTVTGQVATPNITPVSGTYAYSPLVTISDTTANAVIYYTTDGSAPTAKSTVYSGPISVSGSTTVKAIAAASGDTPSAVATAAYVLASVKPVAITLQTSASFVTYGQPVTLTAIVKTTDGTTATGNITFLHGNVPLGTVPLKGGVASLTYTLQETGAHSITANYSGSATKEGLQSPVVLVVVNP